MPPAVDDSWDDLVSDVLGSAPPRPAPSFAADDDDVFDRPTAIPTMPPDHFDRPVADLPLDTRPSDPSGLPPMTAPSAPPGHGAPPGDTGRPPARMPLPGAGRPLRGAPAPAAFPRRETRQEPVQRRLDARLEAGRPVGVHEAPTDPPPPVEGSALELVDTYRRLSAAESAPPLTPSDPPASVGAGADDAAVRDMQDRYAVGDFTGSLVVAESLLDASPEHEQARRYAQSCRDVLTQMYASRLGPLDQIPVVAVPPDQITWLSLDHRSGFLLSLVDGVSSIEEMLDVSGMPRLDALRILFTLVQQNVLSLSP